MASSVADRLKKVKPAAKNAVEKYREVLDFALKLKSGRDKQEGLQQFLVAISDESLGIVNAKALLGSFAERIGEIREEEVARAVCEFALGRIQGRIVSFEEQATQVRLALAGVLERQGEFRPSAEVLCGIPMESGQKIYSATFKMEVYLRIAKLYLEEGDHVSAEAYINRAGMLQSDVDQSSLHVIYRVRLPLLALAPPSQCAAADVLCEDG
jgi:COP9 signalosome complex subunit 4